MVRYTIAMCNLNMADTLEKSIRSIAEQVTEEYEILVIDDGSTDGSLEVLRNLSEELDILRFEMGDNQNLAEARNQSFREAKGEFILDSMDTDDEYAEGITDFVRIFEQLNEQLDFDFYLKGNSINMASKELLLNRPYRSMERAEDHDLWKRLFANDAIIWLEHEPFWEEINSPDQTILDIIKLDIKIKVSVFQSGTTLKSSLRYYYKNKSLFYPTIYYHILTLIIAYTLAYHRGIYDSPEEFKERGALESKIDESKRSMAEIEEEYSVSINKNALTKIGIEIFYNE